MRLHAIKNSYAIYTSASGEIIAEPIEQEARAVLKWHAQNMPANDK